MTFQKEILIELIGNGEITNFSPAKLFCFQGTTTSTFNSEFSLKIQSDCA